MVRASTVSAGLLKLRFVSGVHLSKPTLRTDPLPVETSEAEVKALGAGNRNYRNGVFLSGLGVFHSKFFSLLTYENNTER